MKPFKEAVFYQVWPRSFYDTNHDGIGDLKGIIEKLDYIKSLNVDYIWISPFYKSPQDDYGYDVSDYYSIQSEYGTMEDFKQLVALAKEREIGIICDLVANHTSTHHPWFKEALSNPQSDKRDYYFFRPQHEGYPNNWLSIFGGSAWTAVNDQDYALTLFTPTQADLNWDNPKVREEIENIMSFWLDLGIAGFRLDVFNTISKIEGLVSKDPHKKGFQFADDYILNRPLGQTYLKDILRSLKQKYDFITIGEGMLIDQASAQVMCGSADDQLDMIIHFDLHMLGCGPLGKFDFRRLYFYTNKDFKRVLRSWNHAAQDKGFHIASTMSNHDQPRAVSRFGDDTKYRFESAKALIAINFFNVGSPFIYQGEEIAMKNMDLPFEEWKDFEAKNTYKALQSMMKVPAWIAMKIVKKMSRDHARGVMQWNHQKYAGFSDTNPWFKTNDDYEVINVQHQDDDPQSVLNYTRKLSHIYHDYPVFTQGHWSESEVNHPSLIVMKREDNNHCLTLIVNFSKKKTLYKKETDLGTLILNNYDNLNTDNTYRPYECHLYLKTLK
jgi:oligo-1,6-glucosidase